MNDELTPNWDDPASGEEAAYEHARAVLLELASAFKPAASDPPCQAGTRTEEENPTPPVGPDARDRRRAEARLHQAEARYRTLVEQIPAVTFMAALDEGAGELYVSPQIETLLGFSQKEWLENPILWYTQLHPDDRERWHVEFARTCAAGTRFRSEYRFLARDGHVVWVHGEAQVVRDESGRPLFIQGIAYDITENKQATLALRHLNETLEQRVAERTAAAEERAQELRDSEARTRAILETAVDGIVTIDEGGIVHLINPAAERLFGYGADEVLGRNVAMLMPEPYRDEHDGYLVNYRRTGVRKIIGIGREVVGRRKDGTTFPMELAVSEVRQGKRRLFTGMVRDITERKRTEEQLRFYAQELQARNAELVRSNQDLDDFAYVASHDLKEPLRGISNYASFLIEDYADKLDQEARNRLHTLRHLSARLGSFLDSLLEFSRVGRVDLAVGATDLNEVLAQILESLDISLRERGVTVRIPRPLPTVRCDKVRVGEIFRNLVTNAMKYNDRKEKWIEIGWRDPLPTKRAGPPVFYVRDNGIGIQEKHFESIFRIFKRLHGRDKFGGGTGAGLTIVKKIVERHGGRIWVESIPGEGSTFSFTLHREDRENHEQT